MLTKWLLSSHLATKERGKERERERGREGGRESDYNNTSHGVSVTKLREKQQASKWLQPGTVS